MNKRGRQRPPFEQTPCKQTKKRGKKQWKQKNKETFANKSNRKLKPNGDKHWNKQTLEAIVVLGPLANNVENGIDQLGFK